MRTDFRPLFSLKTFFKKSYELPLTMATENAGHGVLTESNGAVDFNTDLGERPEPTARGFGRYPFASLYFLPLCSFYYFIR